MIDAIKIGKQIAEALVNEPGPCFYPGKFKPPHVGHFEAAKSLAAKNYITEVNVLISNKAINGITPENSLEIWGIYLSAEPNPKIKVSISTEESPVVTMINYLKKHSEVSTVYIAVGKGEVDDMEYGYSLQQQFGDRVKVIVVDEKKGAVTAPAVRSALASGDYESFKEAIPISAYNKGAAPKIFKMLAPKVKLNEPE